MKTSSLLGLSYSCLRATGIPQRKSNVFLDTVHCTAVHTTTVQAIKYKVKKVRKRKGRPKKSSQLGNEQKTGIPKLRCFPSLSQVWPAWQA